MSIPLGYKHSKEARKKMSEARKKTSQRPPSWLGKKHSKETKKKMSEKRKMRGMSENEIKNLIKRNKQPWTDERRKRLSESLKKSWTDERKKKQSVMTKKIHTGRKRTEQQRKEQSERMRGSSSSFWRGGITEIHRKIRASLEYRLWRKSVFERDNYTCIWCGIRNSKGVSVVLNADHIKPFCDYPELRFSIDNGRTLCRNCHLKTSTFGWNKYNKKC